MTTSEVHMNTTTGSTIDDLLRLRDDVGVLSFYVGIDPALEARPRPPWQIQLEKDTRAIRKRLRAEHRHARRVAVEERLTALGPVLAELVDSSGSGRGRALFAGVASGEMQSFNLQVELGTEAILADVPHVFPLLRAGDGRPRAVVLLGRDSVRVIEARLGRAQELRKLDVEAVVYDRAEKKGPAASNPFRGQKSVAQRERWARHVEADHRRRLAAAAEEIGRLVRARGWTLGVVAGDPRGARLLAETLERAGVPAELVDRDLVDATPAHALAELAPVLAAAAERRDAALVRSAIDAAAAGGHGASGLKDVLAALEASRVERLLLDGDRPPTGPVDSDGPRDPLFADRLVLRAHDTGARVTVVGGEASAAFERAGVAALLRR